MTKIIISLLFLATGQSLFSAELTGPEAPMQAKQTHAQTLAYVDEAAQEIVLEHLKDKGLGNFLNINHALSYFKAYRKKTGESTEFLVTDYEAAMTKVRAKALADLSLYFYLNKEQIKNMVFTQIKPFLDEVDKHIK